MFGNYSICITRRYVTRAEEPMDGKLFWKENIHQRHPKLSFSTVGAGSQQGWHRYYKWRETVLSVRGCPALDPARGAIRAFGPHESISYYAPPIQLWSKSGPLGSILPLNPVTVPLVLLKHSDACRSNQHADRVRLKVYELKTSATTPGQKASLIQNVRAPAQRRSLCC